MEKILVTGASGQLGRATINSLLRTQPPERITALVRDPSTAQNLTQSGVELRQGDYGDKASLSRAFDGISRILFVSTTAFSDRETQHLNVIDAAKNAGVKHIVYTSIQRKAGSSLVISNVTRSDIVTEKALMESGLDYTILRNSLYLDVLPFFLGNEVLEKGVRVPAGQGAGALVARADLADANTAVLTQKGHANKIYTLTGATAFSFADVADILSQLSGKPVPYIDVSVAEFVNEREAAGMPQQAGAFLAEWANALAEGEFQEATEELQRIIGRRPMSHRDILLAAYPTLVTS